MVKIIWLDVEAFTNSMSFTRIFINVPQKNVETRGGERLDKICVTQTMTLDTGVG